MWSDLVNAAVGLVLGLVSGYYFERRSTVAAEQHARELEEELASLRTSVYSVGGSLPASRETPLQEVHTLDTAVLERARSTQDAQGQLSKTSLTSFFFAKGHRADDVEGAVARLCESGKMRMIGKWLEVT